MRLNLFAVFGLALLLRVMLALVWYTPELDRFHTGDYGLYHIGATHILEHGDFDNSLFLVRPPLFPLVVAALGVNHVAVLAFDILVGALIAPATVLLARQFDLPNGVAFGAGVIVALDPGSIAHSAFLGPEPLANLLLLLGLLALLIALRQMQHRAAILYGLAAGSLLALSSLTRPATYLLWLVLVGWLLLVQRRQWRALAALALVNVIAIATWTAHNAAHFGNPTFSTVSTYALVYYRAASVERIGTGNDDMDAIYTRINQRVEAELGRDPALADAGTRHGYLAATPDITRALQTVAFDIIRTYPHIYIATLPVGFARMYGLVPGVSKFSGALVWFDTAWNWLLLGGALAGLGFVLVQRRWLLLWLCLLVAAYYTGGILLVKSAGLDTRERSMLTPLLALACALAVQQIYVRWRDWVTLFNVRVGA